MSTLATIEFHEGPYRFSAGHFPVFSATKHERLHGHHYSLTASVTAKISEPGLIFDYKIFKDKLTSLCNNLDSYFLLPQYSPYLIVETSGDYYLDGTQYYSSDKVRSAHEITSLFWHPVSA